MQAAVTAPADVLETGQSSGKELFIFASGQQNPHHSRGFCRSVQAGYWREFPSAVTSMLSNSAVQ